MATNQIDNRTQFIAQSSSAGFSLGEIAKAIVMPLASLRLTVALLFVASLMTWVATMEQAFDDVFNVKMRHFSGPFVEIPIQVFFPPAWFPNGQNIPGSLVLPSGLLILIMMIVNLTAAHTLRFKIQASGRRLVVGILALVAAIGVTAAVIANGQSPGVQTQPLIAYETMWRLLPFFLLAASVASIAWSFLQEPKKKSQRAFLMYLGSMGVMAGSVLWYFNNDSYIGDSAMRIMWQLIQATIAAVAGYIASLLLFKRKAGMVLLHLGVLGLMFNEILVTTMHTEQAMSIVEGQTTSTVSDLRYREMAIVDVSDPKHDRIVKIPESMLKSGNRVSHPDLPFDVQCIQFMQNSQFARPSPDNVATAGLGLELEAMEIPPVAGTDSNRQIDFSAAYVQLFKKDADTPFATHLIAMQVKTELVDSVELDDKSYRILMRLETDYKPYQVTLNDALQENYPGTETPKYFGSEVTIQHSGTSETTDQNIFMNNPLRYSGDTFYQSQMSAPDQLGRRTSTLQVVTNFGWMIPYVCCMFTVVGLAGQFGQSLTANLNKQSKTQAKLLAEKPQTSSTALYWVPALAIAGIAGAYFLQPVFQTPPVIEKNGMRLDLLGQLPVTHQGRVQPLDSFARNTLRQLRTRETVADQNNEKQSAIRWLADIAFDAPESGEYRTFYMTDPNVKNELKLPTPSLVDIKRKQYVYTIDEVFQSSKQMQSVIPNRDKVPENTWTPLQKSTELLRRNLVRLSGIKSIFGPPQQDNLIDQVGIMNASRERSITPYLVPQADPDQPWASMSAAMGPSWIKSISDGLKTTDEIATKIIQKEVSEPAKKRMLQEDQLIERAFKQLASSPAFKKDIPDIDRILASPEKRNAMWKLLDKETRENLLERERNAASRFIELEASRFEGILKRQLVELNNGSQQVVEAVPANVELLQKLKPAYLANDAETFNKNLQQYLASVEQTPPEFYSASGHSLELLFNRFSPFFVSTIMYVIAGLLVGIGWAGFSVRKWRLIIGRAALGMVLLAVLFHATGIIMRIGISGRPPVTNLYSSVLFVTWAGVLIALLLELFTRQSVGSALGAVTGFAGLMWAQSMANIDGDTFTVMVAVLDTTFWLATHVTIISLGYAATFMAGLIGFVFLVATFATPWFNDSGLRKLFANILYGVVCFGLLASFFGTVLGGLWGDDSWGRFWGWDPKENGALMIVLWNALILHARWGGMVKERGVAALALVGNVIVLWSWKGVNALGVGLHAYAASEDESLKWIIWVGTAHLIVAGLALLPPKMQFFAAKD
jgi:ABC-type transport system involved in cytochrome c biogenesis permease subunit